MGMIRRALPRAAAAAMVAAGLSAVSVAPAGAAPATYVCHGSGQAPGVLMGGRYGAVVIDGVCAVNGGEVNVDHDVTLRPGTALIAAFGLDDVHGHGHSNLKVAGDVNVGHGATLILGCDPQSSPCIDDPNPQSPSLSSHDTVGGNLWSDMPLGVISHNVTVGGNVTSTGGGGGVTCDPQGIFAQLIQAPVFSAYEDMTVAGNVSITGMRSCWLGVNRLHVGGNVTISDDRLKDPDAIEILSNDITGSLTCRNDSRVWDSSEAGNGLFPRVAFPNTVDGGRHGMCEWATPTTDGGPSGPGRF